MTRSSRIDLIPEVLTQLKMLRDLSLGFRAGEPRTGSQLSPELCLCLSKLPNLKWFKTNWGASVPDEWRQIQAAAAQDGELARFNSFQSLVLADCLHSYISAYLSIICQCQISGMKLLNFQFSPKSVELPGRNTIKDILETVHDTCDHDRPSRFYLTCLPSGLSSITTTALQTLLSFHKLERVRLRNCVKVDDAAYEQMALAWPELRSVDISSSMLVQTFPSPSIILYFVRHCPRLGSLSLEFDATRVDTLYEKGRPGGGVSNKALKKLGVGRSPITFADRFKVAAFLADIFPSLEEIKIGDTTPDKDNWTEVQTIFRELLVPMRAWQSTTTTDADTSHDSDTPL